MEWIVGFLALIVAGVVGTSDAAVTCVDASGKPVDWFIVYKLPEDERSPVPQIRGGYGHMYMDVHNPVLELSSVWLNATNHAIAYTLQQIYQNHNSKEVAYLMYNDEKPDSDKKTEYYGHTKGVVTFDGTSGFWLVHSTPRFPSNASMYYNWPDNGRVYGQTFLCVTYGYDQFETIGQQLMYNYPWVYDFNLPPGLVSPNSSIASAAHRKHVASPPWNRTAEMVSKNGQRFVSFAKFNKFQQDLYAAWLAPYFDSDLYVETWQNGVGKLNSSCYHEQQVTNVRYLSLAGGRAFSETRDHSKWAVTTKTGLAWTCIGDINRQCHQKVRGGGTVCFQNADAHRAFLGAVTGIQKCPQAETSCYSPEVIADL